MAGPAFAASLILFHLALFTSFYYFARERRREARVALAVALAFLAYVAYDVASDPRPERLGSLAMGLTFMFGILWISAASLFTHVAVAGPDAVAGLRWLVGRTVYWVTSGAVGTIAFGLVFPRLRFGTEGVGPLGAVGLALAALALALVFVSARPEAATVANGALPAGERRLAARRAAYASWTALATGAAGVVLFAL